MNRLICLCKGIKEEKIIQTINIECANDLKSIQQQTGAGCNCGRCIPLIDEIISKTTKKEHP